MKRNWLVLSIVLLACNDDPTGPRPARLELGATSLALAVGDTATVFVQVFDGSGNELIPADGSAPIDHVDFSITPPGIISISQGIVTAIGQGTAQLTGSIDGVRTTLVFTVEGISHRQAITSSETWRAADGPHFVRELLLVHGGATLIIEPGTEVRFSRRAGLAFPSPNAVLNAVGTPTAPIRMTADTIEPPPTTPDSLMPWFKGYWTGVRLGSTASQLRHVEMRYCGGDGFIPGCINIAGDLTEPFPTIEHVTVFRAWNVGITLDNGGFGPGSGDLTIAEAGSRFCHCFGGGAPLATAPNVAGTIPESITFRDNYTSLIFVVPRPPNGARVVRTQRWSNLGLPYRIADSLGVGGPTAPVLTLAAGVRLEFGDVFATFSVGVVGAGDLVTEGTAALPVLLTRPAGSYWNGIVFGPGTSTASRVRHTVIDSAGGFNAVYQWGAAAVVQRNGLDSLFLNTTFRSMSHATTPCDIRRAWTPEASNTDYTDPSLGNTFASAPRVTPQCGPP